MTDKIGLYIYNEIVNMDSPTKDLKDIHTQNLINCSAGDENAKRYVKALIKNFLTELNSGDIGNVTNEIYADYWGLGPIEKYDTPEIDEIMVIGTDILLVKCGKILKVAEKFKDYNEVIAVMRRCLEYDKNKDLNETNAIMAAKRKDGSRINAVIPPVAKVPYLNIRKFDSFIPTTENMVSTNTLSSDEVKLLKVLVKGRANIIVIGEMGSGKTTFMKWLINYIPDDLIVGTMETTFELNLEKLYPNRHWIQLEERLPLYPIVDLFTTMLRQNVDIMIVGESRSHEVNELIKAMSRGHSGCIGTAHSMNAIGVIDDFADMILESGKSADLKLLKYRIAKAIDIVVQFRKLPGREKICTGVYEIVTDEDSLKISINTLFEYTIDEENPSRYGKHEKKGNITEHLKKKLNSYGAKMSEIKSIMSDDYV